MLFKGEKDDFVPQLVHVAKFNDELFLVVVSEVR